MFPVGGINAWFRILVSYYDSTSAIGSSAWLVFEWLATARHLKTSHGDGGSVIAKGSHRWEELEERWRSSS